METLQLLSARVPVGDVTVVAEVPFAYADFQVVRDLNSLEVERIREFGFGNPYLGAEVQRGAVRYGVGVRAPLSTDAAAVVGFLADAERPQSTVQESATRRALGWTASSRPRRRAPDRKAPSLTESAGPG